MKPAPFEYFAPSTREQALSLLQEHGEAAKLLAGGQSLVPAMSFRLAQPSVLVDLNGIADLDSIVEIEGSAGVAIGSMTRQRTVERSELVARRAPLVAETMPFIAHPQIRNRGTFGGSLAHADPASELPAIALALDAEMVIEGPDGRRTVSAEDFYVGLFETALEADEMLVETRIASLPEGAGWAFDEFSRRHGDYALVGVASVVQLGERGAIEGARIALLSVGEGPVLARDSASLLVGEAPSDELVAEVARRVAREIDPPSDVHASAPFRRHLARGLAESTLFAALKRARSTDLTTEKPCDSSI